MKTLKLGVAVALFVLSLLSSLLCAAVLTLGLSTDPRDAAVVVVGLLFSAYLALGSAYETRRLWTPEPEEDEDLSIARVYVRPTSDFQVGKGRVQSPSQAEVYVGGTLIEGVRRITTRFDGPTLITELHIAGDLALSADAAITYVKEVAAPTQEVAVDVPNPKTESIKRALDGLPLYRAARGSSVSDVGALYRSLKPYAEMEEHATPTYLQVEPVETLPDRSMENVVLAPINLSEVRTAADLHKWEPEFRKAEDVETSAHSDFEELKEYHDALAKSTPGVDALLTKLGERDGATPSTARVIANPNPPRPTVFPPIWDGANANSPYITARVGLNQQEDAKSDTGAPTNLRLREKETDPNAKLLPQTEEELRLMGDLPKDH